MRRLSIVTIVGFIVSSAARIGLSADSSPPSAIAVTATSVAEPVPTQVHVKLLISEEKNGKREILSRPVVRTLSGQPASIQISSADHGGEIRVELVAVPEAEVFQSPVEAVHREARAPREGAPAQKHIPISLRLSVTRMPEMPNGSRIHAQLRVWNGEPTSVKVGPLEVQLTAIVVEPEPVRKVDRELGREEVRLLAVLQKRISVEYQEVLLRDVLKDLARRAEVNVVLEQGAMEDAGLTRQTRVTISAQGLRLSTVLDQLLIPLGLDFVVADEVIKITSRTQARGEPVTVIYPVADLITRIDNGRVVPDIAAEQSLLEQIAENLAPETWDRNGGRGSVRVFQATHTLVVRQVADVHDEIDELLNRLRTARKPGDTTSTATERPVAVEKPSVESDAEGASNRAE